MALLLTQPSSVGRRVWIQLNAFGIAAVRAGSVVVSVVASRYGTGGRCREAFSGASRDNRIAEEWFETGVLPHGRPRLDTRRKS